MTAVATLVMEADASSLKQGEAALDGVTGAAVLAETAVDRVRPATVQTGAAMGAMGGQAKQLGWQISQIAQQGAATGNWLQAFAVQAADVAMLMGTGGALGIALSVAASVSLPLLSMAFRDAGSAADEAKEATDEYKSAVSLLSTDFGTAKRLQDEYTAAVKEHQVEVAAAIALEAKALQAKMQLDQIDAQQSEKAAGEKLAAMQAEFSATSDRIAQINAQILANQKLQAAQDAAGGGFGGVDYAAQNAILQANLKIQTDALLEQKDALDRQTAAYAVIDTNLGTLNAKMAINQGLLDSIAGKAEVIGPALDRAGDGAGGLDANLSHTAELSFGRLLDIAPGLHAALSEADALRMTLENIASLSFTNLPGVTGGTGSTGLGWGNTTNTSGYSLGGPVMPAAQDAEYALGVVTGAVKELGSAAGGAASQIDDAGISLREGAKNYQDHMQAQNDAQIGAINDLGSAVTALTNRDIPGALTGLAQLGRSISSISGMGGIGSALTAVAPTLGIFGAVAGIFGSLFGGGHSGPSKQQKAKKEADQEQYSLTSQLYALQGDTEKLRERELRQLDPTNRALQEHVWALQDAAAAAAEAARIESERNGLLQQLYALEGDTEALRALQLEGLDESNRALQEEIWALQDQQAATEATAQAARELADALDPKMFATLLDYQTARAQATYGWGMYAPASASGLFPTSTPVPAAPPGSTSSGSTSDPAMALLQSLLDEVEAMHAELAGYSKAQRDTLSKWDAIGLGTYTVPTP